MGTPSDATERRLQVRVFALTWLSYASYYLTRKNFSVAKKTLETELHIDRTTLGRIDMGYSAAYAVGQVLFGAVADRTGARRVIGVGMLATAACSVAFGLSSTALLFALAFGVNGLAQATGWSANVKAMSAFFHGRPRGAVMGAWTTNYQVGSLLANPLAGWLVTVATWRAAFYFPAIAVALVGVAILFFLPERAPLDAAATGLAAAERRAARARVVRTPLVWAIAVAYFFMKLTRYVLLFWLPYYMEEALRYSTFQAGTCSLAFEVGGAVGAFSLGLGSDRFFGGRRVPPGALALTGLALALPLYAWASPLGVAPNVLSLALVGFFLFGPDALLSATAAQDMGGVAAAAIAAGLINGVGSVGQILSGWVAPVVSRDFGWATLFSVLGVGAIAAVVVLLPFRERRIPQV